MASDRSLKLWIINVMSFILFVVLALTGLLNWLVLPKGYQARGSFLVSLRHFLVEVHEWVALIFIITIVIHIMLHWTYIRHNLKKHGVLK
jgi:hypothetical protein